ncbi:hypothetical protein ABTK65_20020, partial [Acinetobacter baumannii]
TAHNEIANVLQPADTVDTLHGFGLNGEAISSYVNGIVDQQAITVALDHTSLVAAICLVISTVVVWIAPKPRMRPGIYQAGGH